MASEQESVKNQELDIAARELNSFLLEEAVLSARLITNSSSLLPEYRNVCINIGMILGQTGLSYDHTNYIGRTYSDERGIEMIVTKITQFRIKDSEGNIILDEQWESSTQSPRR